MKHLNGSDSLFRLMQVCEGINEQQHRRTFSFLTGPAVTMEVLFDPAPQKFSQQRPEADAQGEAPPVSPSQNAPRCCLQSRWRGAETGPPAEARDAGRPRKRAAKSAPFWSYQPCMNSAFIRAMSTLAGHSDLQALQLRQYRRASRISPLLNASVSFLP